MFKYLLFIISNGNDRANSIQFSLVSNMEIYKANDMENDI